MLNFTPKCNYEVFKTIKSFEIDALTKLEQELVRLD